MSEATDSLRDRIFVAIFDQAPTMEQQFPAGPGHVVGVPDAATVAAKACYRWLLGRGINLDLDEMRWFAEDFVSLYDQVVDTDPDIREAYWKHAHNARLWLTRNPAQASSEAVRNGN